VKKDGRRPLPGVDHIVQLGAFLRRQADNILGSWHGRVPGRGYPYSKTHTLPKSQLSSVEVLAQQPLTFPDQEGKPHTRPVRGKSLSCNELVERELRGQQHCGRYISRPTRQ